MRRASVLAALVLLAAAPAADAGRWTAAQALDSPAPVFGPAIDVNARGDAVLAWTTNDGVQAAFARRGGGFSAPAPVTGVPHGGGLIKVDIDERGNAAVGWDYGDGSFIAEPELREDSCCTRLAGAVRPAGRASFGPARTLSRAGVDAPEWDVAAGPGGGGFLWAHGDSGLGHDLAAAFGTPGGTVGGRSTVLRAGEYFEELSLLIRRGGSASLAVKHGDGLLLERVRSRGGRYGPRRTIARRGAGESFAGRWADARDREFAVWGFSDSVWSTRSPGGAFRTFRRFPARTLGGLDVALDGGVTSVAESGERPSVFASFRAPGARGFSTPRRLATHGRFASVGPRAAAANRGRGMAVWGVTPEEGASRVYARRLLRGAPVGAARRMQVGGGQALSPVTAASASGRTYVVWVEDGRVATARYIP